MQEIAWKDSSVKIQEEAVDAIAELPDNLVLTVLIEVARRHPRLAIREEAIEALADRGPSKRVLEALRGVLRDDESPAIRTDARGSTSVFDFQL